MSVACSRKGCAHNRGYCIRAAIGVEIDNSGRCMNYESARKEEPNVTKSGEPPKFVEQLRFCGDCANQGTPETAEPCRNCLPTPGRPAYKTRT